VQPSFDAAIDALSRHENLTRIKKLLIYTCQSVWESDPYRLEYFDLRSLVYHLLQLAPSREQLRIRLDTFVRTLSKADEYTFVADVIYQHLESLCVLETREAGQGDRQRYYQVAQQLRQDPEQVRIKKILYCAQTRTWENDPAILSQVDLETLLQDLHALIPNPETLAFTLNGIVQTLNRQEYYLPIVQRLQETLASLYVEGAIAEEPSEQTQVMMSPVTPACTEPPTGINPPTRPPTQPLPQPAAPPPPVAPASAPPTRPVSRTKTLDIANLMDVRLQVMKYSNPLRAKVLLFSTLFRPLGAEHRSWEVLKTHELDTLILEAFRAFKTESELRLKLQQMAKTMPEPEHYNQAAGAILRALKPYYGTTLGSDDGATRSGDPDTGIHARQEWTAPNPASPRRSGNAPS